MIHVHVHRRIRVRDAEWKEEEHPRGEGGRFGEGGGGKQPEADPIISKIEDRTLRSIIDRGALKPQITKSRYGPEIEFHPHDHPNAKPFHAGREDQPDKTAYYDPRYAELKTINEDEPVIAKKIAVPKAGVETEFQGLDDPDMIYRGISKEEYDAIQKSGQVKSKGTHNIGTEQEGLTYWTSRPSAADSYANGFAPMDMKPTFSHPAYIVATKRPQETKKVEGTGEHEVGVSRAIDKKELAGIWRGDPITFEPGNYSLRENRDGGYAMGSGAAPSATLRWSRIDQTQDRVVYDAARQIIHFRRRSRDAEWKEDEHTRGGNPANPGQFSKGGGSGTEPPKAEPSTRASAPSERRYETPLGRTPKGIPMRLHQALGDYDFRYKGITDEGVRYENAKTGDILRFSRDANQKATGIWQFVPKEGRAVSGDGDMWETILKERPEYRELAARKAEYEPKPREGGLDPQKTTRESLEALFQQYREKRMQAAQKTDPSAEDYPEQIDRMNEELGPVTRAVQQKMAETVGQAMGVDPKRVYFSDEHPTAKVGDRSFNVGGFAYHHSGRIEMFGVDRPGMNAAGTLAHEMMHVKFESIRQRRNTEYMKWIEASKNEDWNLPQEDRLMTGAGYMTEKAKKEYPLVADWEATMSQSGQWQKLMDDDGITDYSREWWQAFHDKKANGDQATHETLAEMAKLDLEGSLDRLLWFKESTSWKPLYELVNKHYSASADDREHSA